MVRDEKVGVGLRKEVEGRWGDKRGGEGMGRGSKVDKLMVIGPSVAMQRALPVNSTGTGIIGGNQLVAMNTEVRKEHC